jgi:hypothetical protein
LAHQALKLLQQADGADAQENPVCARSTVPSAWGDRRTAATTIAGLSLAISSGESSGNRA